MIAFFRKAAALFSVAAVAGTMAVAGSASAAPSVVIAVDEYGDGLISFGAVLPLGATIANDPGPGGLSGVLTYDLLSPPSIVAGDLALFKGSKFADVIRFNEAGTGGNPTYLASLLAYSNPAVGRPSLADQPTPPTSAYGNFLFDTVSNFGHGDFGVIYQPTAGQPGYVNGFDVTYLIQTERVLGAVPEPATWAAMLLGSGMIGANLRRRRALARVRI